MSDLLIKNRIRSLHEAMDDTADFADEQRQHALFVAEQLNAQQRGPITLTEAQAMQNRVPCLSASSHIDADDDQSNSADLMVIKWMSGAAMHLLAAAVVAFIGWHLMNALLGLLAEAMKP